MRKLLVITAATALLLAGSMAAQADPATASGSALSAAAKNFSPVKEAACQGYGRWCGPGYVRACGPYRCWCRPCY
jgi:hypothetical protein